jgi:NAD(P)-dependent dehydrogenase (short-subunit alcohol dehydrogenase family)
MATQTEIPSQFGKMVVVTGATGGLGYETALALAKAGAEVILTGRDDRKGQSAIEKISHEVIGAKIRYEHLDLASLASIADFAQRMGVRQSLDLLINNAGVMALPRRQTTADGVEMQFGTNYLGHFALTARLMPLLRRSSGPRVVSVSSLAHRTGFIDFGDLQGARVYSPWKAYGQSKLACLIFALELQRRSDAGGWNLTSNAAHPGFSRTNLFASGRAVFFLLRPISRRHCSVIRRRTVRGRSCSPRQVRRQSRAPIADPVGSANCEARRRPP